MKKTLKKLLFLFAYFFMLSSSILAQDKNFSVTNNITANPDEFTLEQNFPNPFNPSTIISWKMPISSTVSIKVYNILGNEVATVVNSELPAGNYTVEYNASNLPSGIYFYTLTVKGFSETKKMTLLK